MIDKKFTDSEIMNGLFICERGVINRCLNCPYREVEQCVVQLREDTLELVKRLKAENDDLFYKLTGVMWSVDKWLEDDELNQHEVNRAITMREKTLQITEELQAEIERLNSFIKEANEYFSEGDFANGLAIIIRLAKEMEGE